jgi:hypothetical protein
MRVQGAFGLSKEGYSGCSKWTSHRGTLLDGIASQGNGIGGKNLASRSTKGWIDAEIPVGPPRCPERDHAASDKILGSLQIRRGDFRRSKVDRDILLVLDLFDEEFALITSDETRPDDIRRKVSEELRPMNCY